MTGIKKAYVKMVEKKWLIEDFIVLTGFETPAIAEYLLFEEWEEALSLIKRESEKLRVDVRSHNLTEKEMKEVDEFAEAIMALAYQIALKA